MNILIASGFMDKISGYIIVPRKLAIQLKACNHKVLFLCHNKPRFFFEGETSDNFLQLKLKDIFFRQSLFNVLDSFAPDLIYTHSIAPSDLLAIKYGQNKNITIFTTVHTKYAFFINQFIPTKFLKKLNLSKLIEKFIAKVHRKANLVFALNEEMKKYLSSIGLTATVVLGNGVDLKVFRPNMNLTLNQNPICLIAVGQIGKRKNQIFFLKMSKFLSKNVMLHIVGGKGWDRTYYQEFVKELDTGKYNNVVYHGELKSREISELYRKSHLYVSASLMEAQSLTQIEALASGIPTIRLLSQNTLGITTHKQTAIHLPETIAPQDFAYAAEELLKNRILYKKMRKFCIESRETYSLEKSAERLLIYFNSYVKK